MLDSFVIKTQIYYIVHDHHGKKTRIPFDLSNKIMDDS